MSTLAFYSKIELLPEHLQQQVLDYIEFLLSREVKTPASVTSILKHDEAKRTNSFAEDTVPLSARLLHHLLAQNPSFDFLHAEEEDIYSDADLQVKY